MSFANMKIGVKLGLVFGFVLLMLVMMIGVGLYSTSQVNNSVVEIANNSYIKTMYASQADNALTELQVSVRMLALLKDQRAIEQEKQKIEKFRKQFKEAMAKLKELEKSPQGLKLIESAREAMIPAAAANNKVIELALAHKQDEAVATLVQEGAPLTQKMKELFDEQLKYQQEGVNTAARKAEALYTKTKYTLVVSGIIAFILGLSAAAYLINNLVTRIKRVAAAMVKVADGDLSIQLKIFANDEFGDLGRSINRTITSINTMIASIKSSAQQVGSASVVLRDSAGEIAQGAEDAAAQAGNRRHRQRRDGSHIFGDRRQLRHGRGQFQKGQ